MVDFRREITIGNLVQIILLLFTILAALSYGAQWKATVDAEISNISSKVDADSNIFDALYDKMDNINQRLSRIEGSIYQIQRKTR